MAFNVRHPIWLPAATRPGINIFALLFFLETMARASTATVVPLLAYRILADEQDVSFLYTSVAVAALAASLAIPALIRRFARRWTYTIGIGCLLAAFLALLPETLTGQALGMFLRVFGTACLNITLNLYIMEFIAKQDYVRNDAVRLAWSTVGWALAPYIGVWLYTRHGVEASLLWSAGWALILLAVFWYLRIAEGTPIRAGTLPPARPIANIGRFLRQPRLRLAWLIAFSRSCFWVTIFIYTPILMVTAGEGEDAGALVVGAANALLVTTLVWQRITGARGVRWTITACFVGLAVTSAACGLTGTTYPWASAALMLAGGLAACGLDAAGPVVFYRAVRPRERPEMTAVYRTYLDTSEVLPSLVYGVLLTWFALPVIYVALGLLMAVSALVCWRHLPRSMR